MVSKGYIGRLGHTMSAILQIVRPALRSVRGHDLPTQVLNVGLTGGIGSGKSTVAQMMQAYGVALVDLDRISHALTQAGGRAMAPILAHFGAQALDASGALNRGFIRERVFAQPEERTVLEQIVHPLIAQEAFEQAHALAKQADCIVYDIPLLVESARWQERLDWIVVVACERETQRQRVQSRSANMSLATIDAIISAQATLDQRLAIANAVIDNRENTANRLNLLRQVDILNDYMKVLRTHKHYKHNLQGQT